MEDRQKRQTQQKQRSGPHDPLRSKARVALSTAFAFVAGLGIASGLGWTSTAVPGIDTEPRVSAEAVQPALDLSDAFVAISEEVTPAVVRIETQRPGRSMGQQGFDLRRFFEPDPRQRPDEEQQDAPLQLSGGTGFVVTPDGYILTNDHVVSGATRVTVYLNSGFEYPARVVGADPYTDVAVLKIDAPEALPTLSLGNSDGVRVGEWVLAVGNPGFGGPATQLEYTVTAGIVSARSRGLRLLQRELLRNPETAENSAYAIEDFIQTDAVINPGNSGGPMVDLRGQVIGINSAIASATGFYQGYGFAIPVNLAKRVMEDLIEYGHVKRPILGVQMRTVSPEDAEYYGLPTVGGALVSSVTQGSPAERAGIRPGDVIVGVEDHTVNLSNELQQTVAQYRPGDEVTVTVFRDGERRDFDIELGEAPLNQTAEPRVAAEPAAESRIGIAVEDITPEIARQLGLDEAGGVIVSNVTPNGPAARQGLVRGLQIVAINGQEVESAQDVRDILGDVEPGQVVNFIGQDPRGNRTINNVRMPRG